MEEAKNHSVVVVGSCNVDLISYVSRFPKAGETLCGTKFAMGCGGKGANQCVMAAKLGAKTTMVGCVGDDDFGDMYKRNFVDLGVDIRSLHTIPNTTTGVAPITVNESGENSIVIVKGANDWLTTDHLQQVSDVIATAKVVLCQLEINNDVTLASLKLARNQGTLTIFNPAPAIEKLPAEFLENTSILVCNETEAEILTGLMVTNHDECLKAVDALLAKGPEYIVLTLGAKGAMFKRQGDKESIHIAPEENSDIKVVDTTGAGDCFVGSLAYYVATRNDLNFAEKIKRSVAIATLSVTKPGTQSSYPTFDELPGKLTI